ncbi:MAG: rRNA pseudouridine synthase [Planctomycetes bacterium]|nr:rRNA pseudouridine synthase [Planctomycetota bacterium]
MTASGKKTLDRALSRTGACSRSQAREAIAAGRVQVNRRTVRDPDAWVEPGRDRLFLDGAPVRAQKKEVWMLHKPIGVVTTARDEHGRDTVYALLPPDLPWLAPVGRLDQDTSGLLLFTNDSDLAHAITAPASKLPKTYEVRCHGQVGDEAIARLSHGLELDDGPTLPAHVERLAGDERTTTLRIVITEGRNRQVRRMVMAIGSRVVALHRSRVGPLALDNLDEGVCRRLTMAELSALRSALATGRDPRRGRTNPGRAR